jgi:hypothetical protein
LINLGQRDEPLTMLSQYFNRDEEIETYLKRYNDEFPDRENLKARFLRVASFIRECGGFDLSSRFWKKADFFTAFIELDYLLSIKHIRPIPLQFETRSIIYTQRWITLPRVHRTFRVMPRDTLERRFKRPMTVLIGLPVG